jgi:chromosome segregation ATPase
MRFITFLFLILLASCSQPTQRDSDKAVPTQAPADNDEELKEILRLTRLITDVEVNISRIQREYGVVQTKTLAANEMGQSNDQKLLMDIDAIFDKIKNDQKTIDNLKKQLKTYKSANADVNRIKQQFEKILAEKDEQINDLSSRLTTIQTTLLEKEQVIQKQAETIVKQINHIENQKQEIDLLSQKYLILYARRETSQTVIEGNVVRIPQRLRRIEIVSFHDEDSYLLNEKNNEAIIQILNEEKFWDYNNYLIVRVRSRSL